MLTHRIEVVAQHLTRDQVAEQLQVSVRTVDRYIADGLLAATKLPGDRLVRISIAAVNALLHPEASAGSPEVADHKEAPAGSSSPDEPVGAFSRSAA